MKKTIAILLACVLAVSILPAYADSALDAFNSIAPQNVILPDLTAKTTDEYLNEIMAGNYNVLLMDTAAAQSLAPHLNGLSGITNKDLAAYAAAKGLTVAQVRNNYYRALGSVLKAEIMINPAAEGSYRDAQTILSLFLNKEMDDESKSSRVAIRSNMTGGHAQTIAGDYQLPVDFVEYIIMNENWDDDAWEDDDDWMNTVSWDDDYQNSGDDLKMGSRDAAGSDDVKELQNKLISMGYLSGKADGIFGAQTESALKEFQLANGLNGDGIFDDDDYNQIASVNAVYRADYANSFDDSPEVTVKKSSSSSDKKSTKKSTAKSAKKSYGSGSGSGGGSYDNS